MQGGFDAQGRRDVLLGGGWSVRARRAVDAGVELVFGPSPLPLTERQARVLASAAAGLSGKAIAIELGLRESTVATHLAAALDRLGLTRAEASAILSADADRPVREAYLGDGTVLVVTVRWTDCVPDVLTAAERDVVTSVLRGLSNERIAAERRRSYRTVANQLASAFRKLEVGSRAELFALVAGGGATHSRERIPAATVPTRNLRAPRRPSA